MERYFTLSDGGGRYKGDKPIDVAKKLAQKLVKNKKQVSFSIRETTKNSKKKTYHYVATKSKDKITVKANKKAAIRGGTLLNLDERIVNLLNINNNNELLTIDDTTKFKLVKQKGNLERYKLLLIYDDEREPSYLIDGNTMTEILFTLDNNVENIYYLRDMETSQYVYKIVFIDDK